MGSAGGWLEESSVFSVNLVGSESIRSFRRNRMLSGLHSGALDPYSASFSGSTSSSSITVSSPVITIVDSSASVLRAGPLLRHSSDAFLRSRTSCSLMHCDSGGWIPGPM
jgi:hypothetical protein